MPSRTEFRFYAELNDFLLPERRAAAQANAAMLLATAQRVADELPLGTDVDDFRRVLVEEA